MKGLLVKTNLQDMERVFDTKVVKFKINSMSAHLYDNYNRF